MNKQYLIFGVVGVLLLMGGGVALLSKGGESVVAPSLLTQGVTKLFNAECRYKDAELCKFLNNWSMPTEYTMTSIMTSKTNPKMEFMSRVNGTDSHTIMKEADKLTHESISLSEIEYQKDLSDGKWWKIAKEKTKTPESSNEISIKTDHDFTKKMEEVEDKTTYVRLGTEPCGKSACYKYQVIDPKNKFTKEYIWFDDEDYLMRKTRTEEIGGDLSVSEMETKYERVKISVPAPVKEGTALDAYGASSGMSKAEIEQLKKDQAAMEKEAALYLKSNNSIAPNRQAEMAWEAPPEMSTDTPNQEVAY